MVNNDTKWGMWLNNNIYICNGIHTRYTPAVATAPAAAAAVLMALLSTKVEERGGDVPLSGAPSPCPPAVLVAVAIVVVVVVVTSSLEVVVVVVVDGVVDMVVDRIECGSRFGLIWVTRPDPSLVGT
jgi:hypothetical protein